MRSLRGHRLTIIILALVVPITIVGLLIHFAYRPESPPQAPDEPTPRQVPEVHLDPALLISREAFERSLDYAHPTSTTKVIPIRTAYWGDEDEVALLESSGRKELAKGVRSYAWSRDGSAVILVTGSDVCTMDISRRVPEKIFGTSGIEDVRFSPDRSRVAILSRYRVYLVDVEDKSYRRVDSRSPVLDAAWSPDSKTLAFTTKDSVFTIVGSAPANLVAHHDLLTHADRKHDGHLLGILSPSWSPSGRYLAYRIVMPDHPDVTVLELRMGKKRTIMEGYGDDDCMYSWSPSDEWMLIAGNFGEPDTSISLYHLASKRFVQIECVGTMDCFQESSWRHGTSSMAFVSRQLYLARNALSGPLEILCMRELEKAAGIYALNHTAPALTRLSWPNNSHKPVQQPVRQSRVSTGRLIIRNMRSLSGCIASTSGGR